MTLTTKRDPFPPIQEVVITLSALEAARLKRLLTLVQPHSGLDLYEYNQCVTLGARLRRELAGAGL